MGGHASKEEEHSVQGVFSVSGFTKNSSDGNTTELKEMVVHLKNGKIAGKGNYGEGSNYNEAHSTVWKGTFKDGKVEWTEVYGGDTETPFIYNGSFEGNKLWGKYRWTRNAAVGEFEFHLTKIEGQEPNLEQVEK